jgi:hypothetical protein
MTQSLYSAIESINALSLEEKKQLWRILDNTITETIAQSEEENWIEDDEAIAQIQQVREEYKKGEYVTFDQYLAKKSP